MKIVQVMMTFIFISMLASCAGVSKQNDGQREPASPKNKASNIDRHLHWLESGAGGGRF
jgi:hypothetical protein